MERDPLASPIQYVKGVGPHRAKLLSRLNIRTVRDALYYLPSRYMDRTAMKRISSLVSGMTGTVTGKIIVADLVKLPRGRFTIFELVITDGSGILMAKWFNQPYLKKNFKLGENVILNGMVKADPYWRKGFVIENPDYELNDEDTENLVHTARVVPVYRVTAGISVKVFRSLIFSLVENFTDKIPDPVPESLLSSYGFPSLGKSIASVHFPSPGTDLETLNRGASIFHQRLSFDELLCLEIGLARLRRNEALQRGISFLPKGDLVKALLRELPFNLTSAQDRVFREVLDDMRRPSPMHRLIQGDVGCGKTVVALMAMLSAVECGYQTALMAPTEILAEQHYFNLRRLVERIGTRICLLTGSTKDNPAPGISSGNYDIIVGTHALIQESISFKNLGLAVIDEQHRFGVRQRTLMRKKAENPDILVMTATPIPRTLAMTVYGDLDYSVIDELPPRRSPVITKLFYEQQKQAIYRIISGEISKGRQVYVVYPVIEESENSDLKSAMLGKTAFEKTFPSFRTGLVHGKMKTSEREAVMAAFKNGDLDILVSTTVIEVGVDIPNATVMLIVHAERFGLAQLHQLRGRVGRGSEQSFCLLLAYGGARDDAGRRLDIMVRTTDGFRIAEEDLLIRGPGEFFGTRQSGMPDLKIANIVRDAGILEASRREAIRMIDCDPELSQAPLLRQSVGAFWQERAEIFKTA